MILCFGARDFYEEFVLIYVYAEEYMGIQTPRGDKVRQDHYLMKRLIRQLNKSHTLRDL